MEDTELKEMWKEYEQKIEQAKVLNLQAWAVNLQTFEYLQAHKAKTKLSSLASFKTWMVVFGMLWVVALGMLIYGNQLRNLYFTVSVAMLLLFTLIANAVYIKHIILIRQMNYSESIVTMQEKLSELQASTIHIVRILWLQMPFYTTWFWNQQWVTQGGKNFWLTAAPATLFFCWLSIWLYRNISYKNVNKKWFRMLFRGKDWDSVIKAIQYLDEIEEFKNR
ncbi:MAG TPA: hypothetical protein VK563_02790 [Puia sp.]|nr:hypothetical protein [Puia sp.]